MTAEFYVGDRIKEMKDLTPHEKDDLEFLEALLLEYEKFNGPAYDGKKHKIKLRLAVLASSRELTVEEKFEVASKLLPNLKKHFDPDKGAIRQVFRVVDEANKLGSLIQNPKSISETIRHYLGQNIRSLNGPMLEPGDIRNYADIWLDYSECVDFETFGGFSDEKWCLGRCLYKPAEEDGKCDTWRNFLSRMNDPEGFSAWIYGVASKRYKGRQILWLQGKHGEDGKTYIQKLIAEALFPNVSQPMVNSALSGDASRWMGAEFIGKTLAYWDDCNNRRALFMEVVKQLSAGSQGNKARIESKGVMAYQGQLDTRLWINSNFAPEVSQDNFITSRLLYITIDKMEEDPDPEIGSRFKAELPQFLRYAKACYERCCPDDYAIVQPDHVSLAIGELATDFEQQWIDIFETHFETVDDPKYFMTAKRVSEILEEEGLKDNFKKNDWYAWVEKRHGCKRVSTRKGGKSVKIVVGLAESGCVPISMPNLPKIVSA